MRPTLFANNGALCRSGLPLLLLLLALMSWIESASANIVFTNFPDTFSVEPGASVTLAWKAAPANGTEDLTEFTLILRALTGQRYTIQNAVPQAELSLTVQIPSAATGGLHSFYAYYTGSLKGSTTSTNQFTVTGVIVTTTTAPATTSTATSIPVTTPSTTTDTGISGGALAGIIIGVVVLLLLTALVFFNRYRRRVALAKNRSRSMDDNKEAGFTSGPKAYGLKDQDNESLTKSAGSNGGPVDGGMVAMPLRGGPTARTLHPEDSPRSQKQLDQLQNPYNPTRNPFDNPDAVIHPAGMAPRQNQYQPPNLPNHRQPYGMSGSPVGPPAAYQQPPAAYQQPPAAYQQQQLQRNAASPYQQNERNSFDSDESAYDPVNSRTMKGGSPPANTRSLPMNGSSLAHSPSTKSSRYPGNMTHQPQPQNKNPFMDDHELMAVTAAAASASAASPAKAPRQLQQPSGQSMHDPRTTSPSARSPPSKMKEIEMQPLDIQQHHLDQQQKMMQRQQQQKHPMPAAQKSINPTQFDDKAELDEDDNVTAYNGYRDTIFGAYAQQQGDDDDEEDRAAVPVPSVPTLANSSDRESATGGAEIQRKKSVKFTGVPPSGPIVLPSHKAVKEHQAQRQQRQQQRQEQQQMRPVSEAEYTEDDDDEVYTDEEEDNIKMRLMMTEAPSPVSSSSSRLYANTGANTSSPHFNSASPVRSPLQQQQPHKPPTKADTSHMDGGSSFGDDFYEDVLAAVEKGSTIPPSTSASDPKSAQAPSGYSKPAMPPVPRSPPTKQATPQPSAPQKSVQQQYIPAPQPQHLQPVNEQVFGAPSPRMAPAVAPTNHTK